VSIKIYVVIGDESSNTGNVDEFEFATEAERQAFELGLDLAYGYPDYKVFDNKQGAYAYLFEIGDLCEDDEEDLEEEVTP
jgi:hypothetical protein